MTMLSIKDPAICVPVLRYRHVTPNGGDFNCTPKHFESQMQYLLARGFQMLSAKEFAQFMQGQPVPRKSVLITFDGGYLDNYVFAYPILLKLGIKASIFLSTSSIRPGEVRANTDGSEILPFCPPHDECKVRINQGHPESVMMNWDEIRLMRQSGLIDFHSFAHTQTRWDYQLNEEGKNLAMHKELEQSKQVLLEELGEVSAHLSWPHGYFDDDYIALAQEEGFHYLYTTQELGFNRAEDNPLHIYRLDAPNKSGGALRWRLLFARHLGLGRWYHRFKQRWSKEP